MNVLEKAEKALEYLKNYEGVAKAHELQAAAGTLGRCLGALGTRQNCARHYANLLSAAVPTLLALASHESAEVRLLGDEALNRVVVGGFAFNSYKTNAILLNQIEVSRNARWIRASLARICLGDSWLRPGIGKIRSQAQTLFPKLSEIVRTTSELPLIAEALESNLPRILNALAEYTTDEEIHELSTALLAHVQCGEASVRRALGACLASHCQHRETQLGAVLDMGYEKLWPTAAEDNIIIGWFCVFKAIFQQNEFKKFNESNVFSVQDFLELYQLCIHYIELTTTEHNVQNAVLECLTVLISQARLGYRKALLEKHPSPVCLDSRTSVKGHKRNFSYTSAVSAHSTHSTHSAHSTASGGGGAGGAGELALRGALRLGSAARLHTPSHSSHELPIQTPDTPQSGEGGGGAAPDAGQLLGALAERLQHYADEHADTDVRDCDMNINIGSSSDDDVRLKYCARLLVYKFLLTGCRGQLVSDRSVRVSVKSSALSCLAEILRLYPQIATLYLDKDADTKFLNYSSTSEGAESNQDTLDEFILERNVCFQDSLTESLSQDLLKSCDSTQQSKNSKDTKSIEKSLESELKSLKDAPSNMLDSKLIASELSADTNMTNSNFTTNSTDEQSTGYPMSSSGGILSSSIDLDMKFDHFGDSTNVETVKFDKEFDRRPKKIDVMSMSEDQCESEVEYQHLSDILLLENHSDPQIRGLLRVCLGRYLVAALELAHGDYNRWRSYASLPKDVAEVLSVEKLMEVILKGLSDEIHSAVNHTLGALGALSGALAHSAHAPQLGGVLAALAAARRNPYWLCRLNLARLYEKLPYARLFMLSPNYKQQSKVIMDTLYQLLADTDQKVRTAAANTIAVIAPSLHVPARASNTAWLAEQARCASAALALRPRAPALAPLRRLLCLADLPPQLRARRSAAAAADDALAEPVAALVVALMETGCRNFAQGAIEALRALCVRHPPARHGAAYRGAGAAALCAHALAERGGGALWAAAALDVLRLLYPVEIDYIMRNKTNKDIFERDPQEVKERWQYLENERVAALSEKFLQVTLKMLNVLVHLIEEVNPNIHVNKSSIALPGSPVRRKTQDATPRKSSITPESDDKTSAKRKPTAPANTLKASFAGHFVNEPMFVKMYDNLRATYSNHKINLDPKSSIFYEFLSTVLNSLAIQLELSTEVEFGPLTEELLFYLKVIMPLCPENAVYCVTQLLKCLFGTNIINQYQDYLNIADPVPKKQPASFYDDVLMVNSLDTETRRDSVSSEGSQKETKDPELIEERRLLLAIENFNKNRMDRKWSANKKELERYIRLFEPVVIQALKMYTLQSGAGLQRAVLQLLCQLLSLRVNYCMLDSDQLFIGFLLKQLDLLEHHEIPNCCELVNSIMSFLVQLSSSKHHSKQIIEIPKLIQLCDGLLAAGAQDACAAGLEPVALRVFSSLGAGTGTLGRTQQQELQATREVIFYMLQKTMHLPRVVELVTCILALSSHAGEAWRWGAQCGATAARALRGAAPRPLARLLARLAPHLRDQPDQPALDLLLRALFAPPPQDTAPRKEKLQYLTSIMLILRKVLVLIPESEILLSINYLKATCIAPQSIFFNVKPDTDPLNVQNVNESCANLSPDVILVRFLFRALTFAIMAMEDFDGDVEDEGCDEDDMMLYTVVVNIIVQVKHMLHLTTGCLFPLTAKSAQSLLQAEQSGLNPGLYSPDENVPLDALSRAVLRAAHARPLLAAHWSHLLCRLGWVSAGYWQQVAGFSRRVPLSARAAPPAHALQLAVALAAADHVVEGALGDAVAATWVVANRAGELVRWRRERAARRLLAAVCAAPAPAALLLHALPARCRDCLQGEFALNTYEILSTIHESQSGPLIFFICRIIGKLEPSLATRFAQLAIDRCKMLKEMPLEQITSQLTKEDVQVALEMLQKDKVHLRYRPLVSALNGLACSAFDLSPLAGGARALHPRAVLAAPPPPAAPPTPAAPLNAHHVKARCCQQDTSLPRVPKYTDLANLLTKLSLEDINTIVSCPDFDRKILCASFKVTCETFIRDFLNVVSVQELKEMEREIAREEREMETENEEMTSSIDSNKINVVNIHVFKKSDSKESKSQFFIPMVDNDVKENFGNLKITEEECEINIPELPKLYLASISSLDKSLAEILRLFPKQSRPLSQSENFNLNVEQTIDRYTRRCHQVFQDKLFYQEFMTIQTILTGFLPSLEQVVNLIDDTDCDLLEKCIENLLPSTLARNLAIFSVVSLQYLSFLISNKTVVETPAHNDMSFRANTPTDNVCVDHVIIVTIDNVAKALKFEEIWSELNVETQMNRIQSAICCLYAVVKYLVKDIKPLTSKSYIQTQDCGPKPDIIITGDKLITLIEYWEQNFYVRSENVLRKRYKKPIEDLIICLSRIEIVSNMALIPPLAWSSVEVRARKDRELLQRVELPLQALQDLDVLEAFLFRVNLIGWSSKKQFEEIWVGLVGALQGNGPHCAVRGLARALCAAAARRRAPPARLAHAPRRYLPLHDGMQRLRSILVDTSAYKIFEDVNLEHIPLLNDNIDGYQYAQFSTEYLKLASDIIDDAHWRVRREVKRKRKRTDIDLNSCLQLLMDVAADMLDPKASTGLAARVALVAALGAAGAACSGAAQWARAAELLARAPAAPAAPLAPWPAAAAAALHALALCLPVTRLQDPSAVHEKLLRSLSASYAPLRQAALRGWLAQLALRPAPARPVRAALLDHVLLHLDASDRISVYAQSLYWTLLFELAAWQPELVTRAVDFLLKNPDHYCTDLVVRGIISCLRLQILPKELKKNIIETLLENMTKYSEQHAVQILMVHLFSAGNKLISPKQTSDVSNMDPDVLMSTMERITLLYRLLRSARSRDAARAASNALRYFLRETLPPAATLSRVVIEFLDTCRTCGVCGTCGVCTVGGKGGSCGVCCTLVDRQRWIRRCVANCEVVFEVFEASVSQNQLPVLSGWMFEALCHLVSGKVPPPLLPTTLLPLLVSASPIQHFRDSFPLALNIFRQGFYKQEQDLGIFSDILQPSASMPFADRKFLCMVAVHSQFTEPQLVRLRELCEENEVLDDLKQCLSLMNEDSEVR
ncbi:huntingtin-like [Zerene cesonia]|uniref:huntingtin-like n=1 Tax=Zerene cesonia TaxID=33412 RepID=UPI0018E55C27|nr:huntingtin-like [Zerene cesonia]